MRYAVPAASGGGRVRLCGRRDEDRRNVGKKIDLEALMIKKTIVALSVATLATAAIALPTAVSQAAETPIQIAAGCNPCNPCAAANPCNPCNPCAAKKILLNPCNPCNPCAAANPCNPCNPCAAKNPCNPCAAN